MARMHARRANRSAEWDEEPAARPPKSSSRGLSNSGSLRGSLDAREFDDCEPASPQMSRPMSHRSASGRRGQQDDCFGMPPSMPAPPGGAGERPVSRDTRRFCSDDSLSGSSSRVRGPATARAARKEAGTSKEAENQTDEALPPGLANASFGKLQEIIAQEISKGEGSASVFEEPGPLLEMDDELRRRKEEINRRREAEAQSREQARKQARLERQRADELRRQQQAEELEREEQERAMQIETKKREEEQCYHEHTAAARIQAHFRGMRSRGGSHVQTPALSVKDLKPHQTPLSLRSTACSTPEVTLLD